jgi:hypothetical protein
MKLPIKLDDLLRQRTVGGERIEYKGGWNPAARSKPAELVQIAGAMEARAMLQGARKS